MADDFDKKIPWSIKNSPMAFFLADESANILWVNEAYTELMGCSLEDVGGQGWFKHAANPADIKATWETCYEEGPGAFHVNGKWRKPDGEEFDWECYTVRMLENGIRTYGFFGVVLDITQRKREMETLLQAQQSILKMTGLNLRE
jgi:PAS domain S-box-containing protein